MLAQTYWNTNFLILTDSFDLNNKFPCDPTSKNRKYVIMFSEFQALRTCELFFVFALMAIGLQLNSGNCMGGRLEVMVGREEEAPKEQRVGRRMLEL